MVQLRLPENSRINRNGKVLKAPAGATNLRTFKVYRYDPDAGENPRVDTFEVGAWTAADRWCSMR